MPLRLCLFLACSLLPCLAGCRKDGSATAANASPAKGAGPISFKDVAAEKGLSFRWGPHPHYPLNILETIGHGCAFLDANGDGKLDILLVGEPTCALYLNQGDRKFQDATSSSGLDRIQGPWHGCAVGDADGDGKLDLVLTGYNKLAYLHGGGDGTFTDQTAASGLKSQGWASSAGFMDLDGDGNLDLVVGSYVQFGPNSKQFCMFGGEKKVKSGCPPHGYPPQYTHVYHNDGHAHFTDVSDRAGIKGTHGKALVLAFVDYDNDGRMDFYLGNDAVDADFMHNLGGMRFENVAMRQGVALGVRQEAQGAMGADWADYDRDGKPDLIVTAFSDEPFSLYHNMGAFFENASTRTGIATATYKPLGFGTKFLDVDNDGWPDLVFAEGHVYDTVHDWQPTTTYRQPTQLLHNDGGQAFRDISTEVGSDFTRPLVARGLATGDFDGDGRVDILVVDHEGGPALFHNTSTAPGHWLELELHGAGKDRFAYGAQVAVRAGTVAWWGEVSPASSYLSSSSPWPHVGLGAVAHVDGVEVRWPDGKKESFRPDHVDRKVVLTEGQGTPAKG